MRYVIKIFVVALLIGFLILAGYRFYQTAIWVVSVYTIFKWLAIGFVAYIILSLIRFLKKNGDWMETFTHELTHTIVGLLFFHKIHSFHAEDQNGGEIWHSGRRGRLFISLAPYCLPIYTYAFLLLRLLGASEQLYIFDIFIGFTLAFHLNCFGKQTSPKQPDIYTNGIITSYLFIIAFLLFNLTVILLSVEQGIYEAMIYQFRHLWEDIGQFYNLVIQTIK
jgi:hypothetical protein